MPMRFVLVLSLLAVAACGSDADNENEAGGAGGGGGGGGGDSGGAGGAGGSGNASSGACTVEGTECDAQEVCVYTDGTCGEEDADRHCEYYPPTCGESPLHTVCGCDGKTKAVNCVVGDIDTRPGACPAPEGQFWCGALSCTQGAEYCNLEFEETCEPLPPTCDPASPSCDCLEPIGGTCMCEQADDGHLEVTCYTI